MFPKVKWSWMDTQSSKEVKITESSIKFTGHSHTPQRRCSDSYVSFGPVMNNLLLDQTNFYWTLPHVRQTSWKTETVCRYPYSSTHSVALLWLQTNQFWLLLFQCNCVYIYTWHVLHFCWVFLFKILFMYFRILGI